MTTINAPRPPFLAFELRGRKPLTEMQRERIRRALSARKLRRITAGWSQGDIEIYKRGLALLGVRP